MASGRHTQLVKQVGEYLVAAEVCRRGFIATIFTGNVPDYDIIASNSAGGHQAIQVKAITSNSSWQFDIRKFADFQLRHELIPGNDAAFTNRFIDGFQCFQQVDLIL